MLYLSLFWQEHNVKHKIVKNISKSMKSYLFYYLYELLLINNKRVDNPIAICAEHVITIHQTCIEYAVKAKHCLGEGYNMDKASF